MKDDYNHSELARLFSFYKTIEGYWDDYLAGDLTAGDTLRNMEQAVYQISVSSRENRNQRRLDLTKIDEELTLGAITDMLDHLRAEVERQDDAILHAISDAGNYTPSWDEARQKIRHANDKLKTVK